jgi:hypothetical protein
MSYTIIKENYNWESSTFGGRLVLERTLESNSLAEREE